MKNTSTTSPDGIFDSTVQRRSFLKYAGAGLAGLAVAATGCKTHKIMASTNSLNLGKGDFGLLNYAYALEQLEAAAAGINHKI